MAETVMKFGPEWLRALSDGGPNLQSSTASVAPAPKYKLAEYRYGREEMLALFTEKTDPPAELKECKEIFSEKCQIPLALVPMSEDEHRLWARCINSDAVLRLAKTNSGSALPLAERERSGAERGGLPTRSRGGGVDRGRGRGRTSYYQRGSSYEDETENGSERRDFRSKAFERSTSGGDDIREKGFDRSIGRGELGEERLRKDTRSTDNWRSGNRNEERSWRNRGRLDDSRPRTTSWRLDDNEENDFRNGPASRRTYSGHKGTGGDHWEDADEDDRRNSLPEWSLDDGPCAENKVGTFDSSGAFREESIDGDSRECEPKNWPEGEKSSLAREEHDQSEEKPQRENTSNGQATEDMSTTRDPVVAEETPKNLTCDKVPPSEPSSSAVVGEPTKPHQPYATAAGSHKTNKNTTPNPTTESSNSAVNVLEEDGFAHLEKAAENMVAQWTLEEDQKERSSKEPSANRMTVLPLHHEDAYKWFYRDPQGELQGPFTPQEMLEWFTAGYFTMDLLVRRGCDEMFSHLGELIKQWNRVPFVPGQNPPPVRNPSSSSSSVASLIPNMPPSAMATTPNTLQIRQQQLMQHQQQQLQRQMYLNQELQMQTQLRQLLAQLKQREGFSELSPQQQQEVLVQHYVSSQQLHRRQLHPSIPSDQPVPNPLVQLVVPLVRGNSSPLLPQPVSSIWDLNGGVMPSPAFEEIQRQEQERREVEEKQRKMMEEEQKRKAEEDEQRRRLEELQRKVEEERMKKEELLRKQEEERRQKEEEERIRMEEERQKMEEEKRRLEEQQRRQEEIKRLEELARKQREEEEKRRREAEEADRLKQQKKLQELERQRKIESEMRRQEQEDVFKRLQEQKKAWGSQSPSQPSSFQNTVSLAEIQRLQEQKDREERLKQAQLQQMQAIFHVQNMQQQQQQVTAKTQLTWANSNRHQHGPVKTLAEIQKEEAERLAKHKQLEEQKQSQSTVTNAGIWSNAASQLSWKVNTANSGTSNSNAVWENCSISVSSRPAASGGFWDCTPASNAARKPGAPGKSNESALLQSNKTSMPNASAKSNSRARKDEESVMKSFENQRRQASDEFTEWCIESLNKFRSYVDIPTFVAFLKDVEPPYEINDYVKSYLGENKEAREFAKQFIEKRSFYRNQAKKEATEEPMWGPAPAITPSANKSVVVASNASGAAAAAAAAGGESDGSGFVKAGKKRKKGKRVDSSILGFTVQADPDRMNAGEIEQIND